MKKFLSVFSIILLVMFFSLFSACDSSSNSKISKSEYMTSAVLWQQKASETKALYYQAFNIAKLSLNDMLKKIKNKKKKPAVVVDIDETVLDNSPYQGKLILTGSSYNSKSWNKWCFMAKAKAAPGAIDFLKYVNSKGVDIFYLSNRKTVTEKATIKNLKDLGFPQAKKENMLLRKKSSSKKARRETISKTHNIIMLCGDNLSDFSELFDKKSTQERDLLVHKMKNEFGTKFIVLPNPMYGSWEGAIYNYNWKLSPKQKSEARKKALTTY